MAKQVRASRPSSEQEQLPIQAVERPILCNPYDEPEHHWEYDTDGTARVRPGRRPASYFYTTQRAGAKQQSLFAEATRDTLPLINRLRDDVRRWRATGRYEGVTETTRTLLRHWANPERERRLFFCQREAVETIIYLHEVLDYGRGTRFNEKVMPADFQKLSKGERPSFAEESFVIPTLLDGALRRYGCKMATGSGKTVVMAMLVAWAFCNRGRVPGAEQFPGATLVLCPNLTVRERLQVLRPDRADNYYEAFDLVPSILLPYLRTGRLLVMNWHALAPEAENVEAGVGYRVIEKGPESPQAFARRLLGDLADRGPLLVLNDEAHHAYRPKPSAEKEKLSADEKAEREEATVWVEGLERLQAAVGIRFCADLSATPFYLGGSGYIEGSPFPWLVSDFGLVDAIESGITKIPRLPVSDSTGRPEPQYFRLWHHITSNLKAGEKLTGGKPKPEVVWREAESALVTLASQWKEKFELAEQARPGQEIIPPVLIIVCDNTEIAEYFYRKISGESEEEVEGAIEVADESEDTDEATPVKKGKKKVKRTVYGMGALFPDFLSNRQGLRRTLRIDAKLLAKADGGTNDLPANRKQAAEALRHIVATVGKRGEPGEQVRCVVSVQMLSEGWDANNVTHILGLRAFGSQLLCEQVVGRALRRQSYTPDPVTGLLIEEYADVYGVPFTLIPFRGKGGKGGTPPERPVNRVRAIPSRAALAIRFPVVEGYAFALQRNLLKANVSQMEELEVTPDKTPTALFVQPQVGINTSGAKTKASFAFKLQTRKEFYESTHLQAIEFDIARQIVTALTEVTEYERLKLKHSSRHQLFPQVLGFVQQYVNEKIKFKGQNKCELGLETYTRRVIERLLDAIEPDDTQGESPMLPILNQTRPTDSTARVSFTTARPVYPTVKSHLDYVVVDTETWEQSATFWLEASDEVVSYAKNDHLECGIPYDYLNLSHTYFPDFLVRLKNGNTLLLEVKGYEHDQTKSKHQAAHEWIAEINNWAQLGHWQFGVCSDPQMLPSLLTQWSKTAESPRL